MLFKLLFPHLRLTLPVNKAVLENAGSLINRDKRVFYSPFCAPGKFIRELLADGYIGREGKPAGYPVYTFPLQPKIPDSVFGVYLQRYYDVFMQFVDVVLQQLVTDDDVERKNKDREMIGLWAECISEWIPGFPNRKDLLVDQQKLDLELLSKVLTMILWDLSLAHGTDHICIHNKQSHGNPFRLRVPPPGKGKIAEGWYEQLVTRWDLLSAWFTDLLFYEPHNVTLLQDVDYEFSEPELKQAQQDFLQALHDLDKELKAMNTQVASLDQIPTSIQY
ncbi:hypothetical protein [Methyloprofundus sp.]|uniref:hypothetical protein n=1 Tax=Methyloprofundus sp. TaxID=2020875 RepID=UPI003D0F0D5C